MKITVTVNGTDYAQVVEPRLLLIHFLRDELRLTGSHWGCDTSNCGACVVWLDETPVKSCTVLAVMADGRRVTTIEGLAFGGALDPVQEAFAACHGLQCGFCTPGMIMTARWLLDHNPDPSPAEVREAISGQVCRCTGYENIVKSVLWAAKHDGDHDGDDGEPADERRLRAGPPQGRRAVHQGEGHLHRRHRAARHAAWRDPAQPARARSGRLGRRHRRPRPSDGGGRAHRGRPSRTRHGVDAHGVRRRAGGAGHRQGALPGPGDRVRGRDRPVRGQGRARADRRRLRAPAAAHRRPDGAGPRRARGARGPARRQPHLRLVRRRQGGHRRGVRRGGRGGRLRHDLPAVAPGAARDLWRDRRLRRGQRQADLVVDQPGAARPSHAVRGHHRAARAQDPDRVARPGRRLRRQGARLPRLPLRDRRVDDDGPAREMGGGQVGEPDVHHVRARLSHARRDRRDRGRGDPRAARPGAGRPRRVQRGRAAVQVPRGLLSHLHRVLPDARRALRGHRRIHQQGAGRCRLLLLVPHHRGRLPGRAADRHAGPRTRHGSGGAPDAEPAAA